MRNTRLSFISLAALLGPTVAAHATSTVAYVGTYPQYAGQPPVTAGNISSFGIDADSNRYFADYANGTVLRVAPNGSIATILSGLKVGNAQTSLVVDYRGNLFVADPGNHRIVFVAAGSTTPIVRATPSAAHSLAVDTVGDCFYHSGTQLYQLPPTGEPRPIANIPGATFIAYGPASAVPATAEDDTLYILSTTAAHAYTVSTFTYHNGAGTLAVDRTFTTPDPIKGFVVDAGRNLILSTATTTTSNLVQVSPAGQVNLITSVPAGEPENAGAYLALDYNRNLYYLDNAGLTSLMPGAVNFGNVEGPFGGGAPYGSMELVVAVPPGQTITTTETGDFSDNFDPSSNCGWPGNLCYITVSYYPQSLGLETGSFLVQDDAGNTLASVPLYGTGLYPLHNIFMANGSSMKTPLATAASGVTTTPVKSASGISATNASLPVLVTDVSAGSLVTPFLDHPQITPGLGKPQTVAQYPFTATYVTQTAMPGILRIDQNGTRSRVAQRLVGEPNGVAIDAIGNLYIADQNSVFRVGIDGTETPLAVPANDGGYERADSIAVDGGGNVYTFFHAGGPSATGGLVKINPAGTITPLAAPEGVLAGTSMALDSGGGLYISDGLSRTLSTVRTDETSLTLLSGLKAPRGVSGYAWPAIIDQGTDSYVQPALPNSAFSFGNVPVGTSVTRTFTLIASGNEVSIIQFEFGPDPEFTISSNDINIAPGGEAQLTITYRPTKTGPYAAQLNFSSNDFNLPDGSPSSVSLTGTGVAK